MRVAALRDFHYIPVPNDDHTTLTRKPPFLRRAMAFRVDPLQAEEE